jgi:Family of unknown function (DUF5519)
VAGSTVHSAMDDPGKLASQAGGGHAPGRPSERVAAEVLAWPGVEAVPHRYGGVEFRVGRRQLGHLHGDEIADVPLPRGLRDELIAAGRARVHRWRPDSGWVTVPLEGEQGIAEVVGLLRRGYERARLARERHERADAET